MGSEHRIVFGPFNLDLANERLTRDARAIPLRPKAFAVLRHLAERPGRLVTKDDLLREVWPGTFVGDAVLKVTIRQLREALEDDSKTPLYIETAHRRGYRFVGAIASSAPPPPAPPSVSAAAVVGRQRELARLERVFERVRNGARRLVFVGGEAGIGKTALVDAFAEHCRTDPSVRLLRGQCLEQFGTSEAYLPIFEAVGRLCREDASVIDVLRSYAPMWLQQMPSLVRPDDRAALARATLGSTRARMLREMSETLDVVSADSTVVLVVEDLHWSDESTLDLLSIVARNRAPARLFIIGTYRHEELGADGHPLNAVRQALLGAKACDEMSLGYLDETEIAQYLTSRFLHNRFPTELAPFIHARTEGNPLFMVNAVDDLVEEGRLVEEDGEWSVAGSIEDAEVGVPRSILQMIEKQLARLRPEQRRALEAASVAGAEFSGPAVVSAAPEGLELVEEHLDELASRRQFVEERGTHALPDGEIVGRYGFIHALYQHALYDRIPAARRAQYHRRIAEEGERRYADRAPEIAAELAMHFERGASVLRAAFYHQQAAKNAIRRFAYRDAVGLARRGLELLETHPDGRERDDQELCLQLTLGVPLVATMGYAAPDVGAVYVRARELCGRLDAAKDLAEVLWGLWTFHTLRGELRTACSIGEELIGLAERIDEPCLALAGHWSLEITSMHRGAFERSLEHFDRALAIYEDAREDSLFYAQNPAVAMRSFGAWTLWFLGKTEKAAARTSEALALARELAEPHGLAHAHFCAAVLHQLERDPTAARTSAEAALEIAAEHGLVLYHAMGSIVRGWAMREPASIRVGLAAHRATGAEVLVPHFLAMLAEALAESCGPDEALACVDEAFVVARRSGEFSYEAELLRLRAELLLRRAADASEPGDDVAEAEACLERALRVAREQSARALELRAATTLARHYACTERTDAARALLTPLLEGLVEGAGSIDGRAARTVLGAIF